MRTTAAEAEALIRMAGNYEPPPEIYGELYGKGLIAGNRITEAGKAHLRTIAGAMAASPGKRTFTVRKGIVRNGRTMEAGETFEASPAGTHVQRWLSEGRIA